ncbi:MAG TPA: EF-P beta-lysylation protein EpmB [Arenimonas sp.]|nr:EF-P beta-lysylation protein EpmB [Arenimonas sp.]
MITANSLSAQPKSWQMLWREAVRDPRELLEILDLGHLAGQISDQAAAQFPLRVPRGFIAKMRRGDANDPLLRQVLPIQDEEQIVEGYGFDAVGDAAAKGGTGIIHKYHARALLITTGSCAIHCRYCFRRHFPYAEETAASQHWAEAITYLKSDSSITELILSGGDPLSLSTAKLKELTDAIAMMPQIKRLRLHTRLPVVLPERIDAELLDWIHGLGWPLTVVIHANHAQELMPDVAKAVSKLRRAGSTMLNQAVLLKGVNDQASEQIELSERLFDIGVLPYYLHQLDKVQGAAHFQIDDEQALAIHQSMMQALPGYLVPKLVREVPGEASKTPL